MQDIYLLLTCSSTYLSRIIKKVTESNYTHASIGFDGLQGQFYSFGRKDIKRYLPAGFITEVVTDKQIYSSKTYYTLYKLRVTDEQYYKIKEFIKFMMEDSSCYGYNICGLICNYFGFGLHRRHHYYCSQFVARALYNAGVHNNIDNPYKITPQQLSRLHGLREVSSGYIGALVRPERCKID